MLERDAKPTTLTGRIGTAVVGALVCWVFLIGPSLFLLAAVSQAFSDWEGLDTVLQVALYSTVTIYVVGVAWFFAVSTANGSSLKLAVIFIGVLLFFWFSRGTAIWDDPGYRATPADFR
jgi:chromate transport protein ChrA